MQRIKTHFIPPFIKYSIHKHIYRGTLNAGVLFIDIKGFTKTTSYLQKYSQEGAEIISDIINKIFSPSIKYVYDNGGFISSFAGDAFTAIFPNNPDGMINAAIHIKNILSNFSIETKLGKFKINTKISLSYSNIEFQILKNKFNTYYFYGKSIEQASKIKHTKDNKILCHKSLIENINVKNGEIKRISKDIYEIIDYRIKINKKTKHYALYKSIEKQFLINEIFRIKTGEFRDIVSVFIHIKDIENIKDLNNAIFNNMEKYGAYYNKIDYGDKGIVIVLLFGAPSSREKQIQNAIDFAVLVKEFFIKRTNNNKIKIGISSGIAYTGFVGSEIQSEYTAIGKSVNLSARLMSIAQYGEIYTNKEEICDIYKCKKVGKRKIKGFSKNINILQVLYEKKEEKIDRDFINREREIKEIEESINSEKIIYVQGNAGIGKTSLIEKFIQKNKKYDILIFNKNNYSNKSFSVFKQLLNKYFNKQNFTKEFNSFIKNNKELIKFAEYYKFLLNINNKKKFENISDKVFNDNIKYALILFIKILFKNKNVILIFDDIDLLDYNSFLVIENIISNNIKIIFLGRKPFKDIYFNNKLQINTIILNGFNKTNTKKLIKQILNHNIHSDILNYIQKISKGNPLIIKKSILFLKDRKFIGLRKNIYIFLKNEKISINLGSVFLYEFDLLDTKTKEILRIASIIGNDFSQLILNEIVQEKDINKILQLLVNRNILKSKGGGFYSFTNTLLRDAIYNTILKKHSSIYHNKIAKIYEQLLNSGNYYQLGLKKEDIYGIIGYHYEKSNKINNAKKYLMLSAKYYKNMYLNTEAIYYFNTILKYANIDEKKIILPNIIDIYIALGKIDNATEIALLLKKITNEKKYLAISLHRLSLIYGTYKSQFSNALKYAQKALKLYIQIKDDKGIADMYGIIGGIYQALNKNKNAIEFLNKSIIIAKKQKYSFRLMISSYYLAFTYYNISQYNNALKIIHQMEKETRLYEDYENTARVNQLKAWIFNIQGKTKQAEESISSGIEIANLISNKPLLISLISDNAALEKNRGNFKKAIELYKQCINMEKENNLLSNTDVYNNNIGMMYYYMKKYNNTIHYFIRALEFAKQIKDYKRMGIYSGNIGELYMYSGDLEKSIDYLINAVKYEKKANYIRGAGLNSMYLANAYKYNNDYSKALKYYNRAIKYLNDSDKSKVVNVLFEKIDLYIKKSNKSYAIKLIEKCLRESENIDQLIFLRTKIIYMYLNNEYKELLNLSKQYENIIILADIYFYLFLLLKTNKLKRMAIKTNNVMIKQHSDYVYIYRKKILK